MTVFVINKHGAVADRVVTISGVKYTSPQKYSNPLNDIILETEISKIEVTPDNCNIKAVMITGAVASMSTSITKLIKETNSTLEDVFALMRPLNADYQNGDEYSVITLKNNGDIEELLVLKKNVSYSLYLADERCRVFGSGETWLFPLEGKVTTFDVPLTMHEQIVMLHTFTSEFGKTYDHYDLPTDVLKCKIDLTLPARKKIHKSAVKKIAGMSLLHPNLTQGKTPNVY